MSRTQKNKATEYHIGRLKAQLAKLRTQLMSEESSASGKGGEGWEVQKQGDARIALIGYPSVGKSTLQSCITSTKSTVGAYDFTTLDCIPGVIDYRGAQIQLLDLPGIIEGASKGRGRGKQVIAITKSADLVLMVLDATRDDIQKEKLTTELENVGIRLNKRPPNIGLTINSSGGIKVTSVVTLTHLNDEMVKVLLNTYKIFHALVIIREDCTVDELIDVIEGNRKYISCIYVYNKIDMLSLEQIDELARRPHSICISSDQKWNFDQLLELIWQYLSIVKVYTKRPGEKPDLEYPLILTNSRGGSSVKCLLKQIHRDLVDEAKCALVWGRSVPYSPKKVSLTHILDDDDVVQIVK